MGVMLPEGSGGCREGLEGRMRARPTRRTGGGQGEGLLSGAARLGLSADSKTTKEPGKGVGLKVAGLDQEGLLFQKALSRGEKITCFPVRTGSSRQRSGHCDHQARQGDGARVSAESDRLWEGRSGMRTQTQQHG